MVMSRGRVTPPKPPSPSPGRDAAGHTRVAEARSAEIRSNKGNVSGVIPFNFTGAATFARRRTARAQTATLMALPSSRFSNFSRPTQSRSSARISLGLGDPPLLFAETKPAENIAENHGNGAMELVQVLKIVPRLHSRELFLIPPNR